MKKAVIILSGGLDSSTCLYIAKDMGYEPYALTFNYGQKHLVELESARLVAQSAEVKDHRFINLPKPTNTALTDERDIPENRNLEQMSEEIPITYVPARNTLFIAFALQYAEEIDAEAIFTGVTAIDYSGYPDCRPEYIQAWQNLINLATRKTVEGGHINLITPLLNSYKAEIIEQGMELEVPYNLTTSCYNGKTPPCMKCDSCKLRIKGFIEAGFRDPLIDENIWKGVVEEYNKLKQG